MCACVPYYTTVAACIAQQCWVCGHIHWSSVSLDAISWSFLAVQGCYGLPPYDCNRIPYYHYGSSVPQREPLSVLYASFMTSSIVQLARRKIFVSAQLIGWWYRWLGSGTDKSAIAEYAWTNDYQINSAEAMLPKSVVADSNYFSWHSWCVQLVPIV